MASGSAPDHNIFVEELCKRIPAFSRGSKRTIGVKPWAGYVKSGLVTISVSTTMAVFQHPAFRHQIMLHLRAQGFAPITKTGSKLLKNLVAGTGFEPVTFRL
jgi:hypothetical protein